MWWGWGELGQAQNWRGHSKGLGVQVLIKPRFRPEILLSVQYEAIEVSLGELHALNFGLNTDLSFCSPRVFPGALPALGLWVTGCWKLRYARLRTHALESEIVGFKFQFYQPTHSVTLKTLLTSSEPQVNGSFFIKFLKINEKIYVEAQCLSDCIFATLTCFLFL